MGSPERRPNGTAARRLKKAESFKRPPAFPGRWPQLLSQSFTPTMNHSNLINPNPRLKTRRKGNQKPGTLESKPEPCGGAIRSIGLPGSQQLNPNLGQSHRGPGSELESGRCDSQRRLGRFGNIHLSPLMGETRILEQDVLRFPFKGMRRDLKLKDSSKETIVRTAQRWHRPTNEESFDTMIGVPGLPKYWVTSSVSGTSGHSLARCLNGMKWGSALEADRMQNGMRSGDSQLGIRPFSVMENIQENNRVFFGANTGCQINRSATVKDRERHRPEESLIRTEKTVAVANPEGLRLTGMDRGTATKANGTKNRISCNTSVETKNSAQKR